MQGTLVNKVLIFKISRLWEKSIKHGTLLSTGSFVNIQTSSNKLTSAYWLGNPKACSNHLVNDIFYHYGQTRWTYENPWDQIYEVMDKNWAVCVGFKEQHMVICWERDRVWLINWKDHFSCCGKNEFWVGRREGSMEVGPVRRLVRLFSCSGPKWTCRDEKQWTGSADAVILVG